jgi:hypothetical protein
MECAVHCFRIWSGPDRLSGRKCRVGSQQDGGAPTRRTSDSRSSRFAVFDCPVRSGWPPLTVPVGRSATQADPRSGPSGKSSLRPPPESRRVEFLMRKFRYNKTPGRGKIQTRGVSLFVEGVRMKRVNDLCTYAQCGKLLARGSLKAGPPGRSCDDGLMAI